MKIKILKILNNLFKTENCKLILMVALGAFLRSFKARELFMYSHDQDLQAWVISDILGGHLRLIGQETSVKGVFIGGLFYYLLIPFYLLTNLDPIGGVFLPIILGIFAIISVYWVFKKIFSKEVALIAMIFYSLSLNIVFTDREVAGYPLVYLVFIFNLADFKR